MEEKIKKLLEEIKAQINRTKDEDSFLFSNPRVYESCISHRLAIYLKDVFPKHNIDVEYDKYGEDQRKELDCFKDFCTDNSTDRIRPDIIVHHRGMTNNNLLVVEIKDIKASATSKKCVNEKLVRLTNRNGSFGYLLGVLWLFGEENKEKLFIYVNGIKYDSDSCTDFPKLIETLKKYEIESDSAYNKYRVEQKEFLEICHGVDQESKVEGLEEECQKIEAVMYEKDDNTSFVNEGNECYEEIDIPDDEINTAINRTTKIFSNASSNLKTVTCNSLLHNHLQCSKDEKELIEMALTHNDKLYVFDEKEEMQIQKRLELLNSYVYRF